MQWSWTQKIAYQDPICITYLPRVTNIAGEESSNPVYIMWDGSVINPWRTCAAKVSALSAYCYSGTTGYEAANEWHHRFQNNENNVAILLKRLRSRDMA